MLAAHPGVAEVAVIGVPDEVAGEAVCAFVVRKDPALTEAELREHCRQSLTAYKVPRVVHFRARPAEVAGRQGAAQGPAPRWPRPRR